MGVDYEQLLKDNEAAKQGEINKVNEAYGKTASEYQAEVDKQQQQLEDYKAEQTRLQQEQTDFAIDKINQQQEQAEKNYTKEQQAAYGDYKKQTDPYGANAEQMAAMGLSQSGYSESSNVAMYTAYQNRVAAARASIEQAKLTFENAIREAKLTNDINLAKIAQETLEKSLALSMESIVYLGNLELEKAAKLSGIEQTYYDRAQDIRDAQQKAMVSAGYTITGEDATWEELLAAEYPTGVVDDVEFWNQMAEAAGSEEALKELGYQLVNKPVGIKFTQQVLHPRTKEFEQMLQIEVTKKAVDDVLSADNVGQRRTDNYTLMVEEYEALKEECERLKDVYFSAQRTYEAVAKWGPAPEQKAAYERAKSAYEQAKKALDMSPVKINPEYEKQKKKVEQARAAWNYATSKNYTRNQNEVDGAKKNLEKETEILNNMKPYLIQKSTKGNTFRIDRLK